MTKFNKGDLVAWRGRTTAHRGIVLGESHDAAVYRVWWLGDGLLGEHYRDDLIKIEVESD